MVVCRILEIRWLWRYKFYLIVLAIMSVQIFFAVIFFTLYEETDRNSDEIHISHIAIEVRILIITRASLVWCFIVLVLFAAHTAETKR